MKKTLLGALAIFAAATGGRYLSSNALSAMHYVEGQSPFWRACHLSHREIEVMRFYMNGLSVSEIARRFGRSIKTISSQKSSAMKKLGIGRLPGDFTLRLFGREYPFPFMSTILLSLVLSLLARAL